MPEFPGINLLFLLHTNGDFKPFIILTGKGSEEISIKALNLGADYYLQKRFDFSKLIVAKILFSFFFVIFFHFLKILTSFIISCLEK